MRSLTFWCIAFALIVSGPAPASAQSSTLGQALSACLQDATTKGDFYKRQHVGTTETYLAYICVGDRAINLYNALGVFRQDEPQVQQQDHSITVERGPKNIKCLRTIFNVDGTAGNGMNCQIIIDTEPDIIAAI